MAPRPPCSVGAARSIQHRPPGCTSRGCIRLCRARQPILTQGRGGSGAGTRRELSPYSRTRPPRRAARSGSRARPQFPRRLRSPSQEAAAAPKGHFVVAKQTKSQIPDRPSSFQTPPGQARTPRSGDPRAPSPPRPRRERRGFRERRFPSGPRRRVAGTYGRGPRRSCCGRAPGRPGLRARRRPRDNAGRRGPGPGGGGRRGRCPAAGRGRGRPPPLSPSGPSLRPSVSGVKLAPG